MDAENTKLILGNTTSGAEELAKKVPRAYVVSAFNTIPSEVLFGVYESRRKKIRPSLVYCGDDDNGSMQDLYASLGIPSHLLCSSLNLRMRAKANRK
jgi:predicted dinucleotide-binding enzyme